MASGTDDLDLNNLVGDRAEVSTTSSCHSRFIVHADFLQIDAAEITESDNDLSQQIDTKCVAVSTCVANSGDHRKVVSHIFGRNKTCTRELPDNLWIFWCRKHYQRFKYRAEDAENWHTIQLGLVRNQLQTFEDWGEIHSWTISLRKAEQDAIAKENRNGITYTNYISTCWERFLVPYLGANKTFAEVRQVLQVIERKFAEAEYVNRDKKLKSFPGVEFLPVVQRAKEVKKPAAKRGQVTYKKITLDQPQFKSKNRANNEYIKIMAAKKRQTSTPDSAGRSIKKERSPTLTDKPLQKKRKSSSPLNAAPLTVQDKTLPTKRRRLTRGYEMHGSGSDRTSSIEKDENENADADKE